MRVSITRKEIDILNDIVDDWGITVPKVSGVDIRINKVEALLHETCHGVALGLSITKETPGRISVIFDALNANSKIVGLTYEAQALAIERRALAILGWQKRVIMSKVLRDTWEQGESGSALPLKTYLSVYRGFLGSSKTRGQAQMVVDHIIHLTKSNLPCIVPTHD